MTIAAASPPFAGWRDRLAATRSVIGHSRGERFAARMRGAPLLDFRQLAGVPHWLLLPGKAMQSDVAAVTALLRFRVQIDRELSGAVLGAIASTIGEALFDAACAAQLPPPEQRASDSDGLPAAEALAAHGWTILHAALPPGFAARYPGAAGDDAMRALADAACAIVVASSSNPDAERDA